MIGYVTLGSRDLPKAAAYFDELLGTIGATRLMDLPEGFILWGRSFDDACVAAVNPHDQQPATVGNGVMVALRMDGEEAVGALHAKAMELGSADEGAPGPRGDGFYAAYFRDLDGNKFCAFCIPA